MARPTMDAGKWKMSYADGRVSEGDYRDGIKYGARTGPTNIQLQSNHGWPIRCWVPMANLTVLLLI